LIALGLTQIMYLVTVTKMLLRLCTADRSRFVLSVKSVAEFYDKGTQTIYINYLYTVINVFFISHNYCSFIISASLSV